MVYLSESKNFWKYYSERLTQKLSPQPKRRFATVKHSKVRINLLNKVIPKIVKK